MLYMPPAFRVEDHARLWSLMETRPFATLITQGEDRPLVSHVPLMLDRTNDKNGTLFGHLAKGNPQIVHTKPNTLAVAVFQGPDAYISPGWYPTKQEHGKVVPTWNYAVVHARGPITFLNDAETKHRFVDLLTRRHERSQPKPWATSDAPEDYMASQLKGIVGFELEITELDGKFKLSQNRSEADQHGVITGLSTTENASDAKTADMMKHGGR